jgi:phosphatidylserine/phosphatidylglycerophosphate/cardiolipin synthase-like enzyme
MSRLVIYTLSFLFFCGSIFAAASELEIDSENPIDRGIGNNNRKLFYPGSLAVLPQDGRKIYFEAFAAAQREIRIEICVLKDPQILQSLQQALNRGIKVRVIVDNGKYQNTPEEQINLATYLTGSGGELQTPRRNHPV